MRNFHSTFIRATKKIINQRLKRTNSPDTRRAPHSIDSPFNIPHPHSQAPKPSLYILVKTTAQGVLKKVSLPLRNEEGIITSPGDAAGFVACACKNPNDPSEHHNFARLISQEGREIPTLTPNEHYVASPLIFPNILIQDPLENNTTSILVKLPDHVTSTEQMTREQTLEIVHQVLNDLGSTEVSDNIYTERFTIKALGIQPSAPPITPQPDQSEHSDQPALSSFQRADLSKNWVKGYTEKTEKGHGRSRKRRTTSKSQSDSDQEETGQNHYELPNYMDLDHMPPVIIWTANRQMAPSIDVAFLKWNPNLDIPTEKIKQDHKAIVFIPGTDHTNMAAITTELGRSIAITNMEQFYKAKEDAGKVRAGILGPRALRHIHVEHISNVPNTAYETIRQVLQAAQGRSFGNPESDSSNSRSRETSVSDGYTWDRYGTSNQPKPRRQTTRQYNSVNHQSPSDPPATCPHCKAMFANATAALQHVQNQHQNQPSNQEDSNQPEKNKPGKAKILKASQYQDSYIHISLPDDEAAHFFTATAQTAKDPRTNTIESRYIAPRFPETILAIEDLVAFKNIATKEFQCWFKAYQQITRSKQLGSYRTYAAHNIGLENAYISLMILGQKDKIITLKANAPVLNTTKISELNEHLVASWFHNQRVYCLESRVEWSSWFDFCFSERTAGREIYERVHARLTSYPTAMETLKTASSFIEHIVTSLLPVQVPYSQRRMEIIAMHVSQLNSIVPTVDFTRQHIDSHAMELKFLHPATNSATPLSSQEESRLQANIVDEMLHEILAGTPFFSRLHQLYLPNPQYQDIRRVPKAKILEDLARIIATDRTTGNNTTISTMQTSTTRGRITQKEPARCTACAALNVSCSPSHCRTHQPVWTTNQARAMQRNNINPFIKKNNCNDCQEESIIKGIAGLKTKDKLKRSDSNPNNKSSKRSKSRSRSRGRTDQRKNSPNPKTTEQRGAGPPKVRTILSRSSDKNGKFDTEPRNKEYQNYQRNQESPTRSQERYQPRSQERYQSQKDDWNYARKSPEYQRQKSPATGWHQRSPSPRNQYGARSRSPKDKRTRRYSPYRSRSQSASRSQTRNQTYRSRPSSQEREPRNRNPETDAPKPAKQD